MAVLGLFLKYIFLIAIMVAIFVIGTIAYFMHRVRSMAQQFSGTQNKNNRQSRQSQHTAKHTEESVQFDEELYDSRSSRQANRKIFSKNEGEYVDFEEEK